jgi:hypothetical protein
VGGVSVGKLIKSTIHQTILQTIPIVMKMTSSTMKKYEQYAAEFENQTLNKSSKKSTKHLRLPPATKENACSPKLLMTSDLV